MLPVKNRNRSNKICYNPALLNLSGVLAVLALTLTGCSLQTGYYIHAEYKPVEYQADHSKAWNIANASGIHLDDHDVAEQQIKKNEGESISDAYARSLALHGLGGFSWVSSIFLSEALAPTTMKDSANQTAIISFQPESRVKTVTDNAFPNKLSDQASRLASHDFNKAVKSALDELHQQFPNIKPVFFRNTNTSTREKDSAYNVLYVILILKPLKNLLRHAQFSEHSFNLQTKPLCHFLSSPALPKKDLR